MQKEPGIRKHEMDPSFKHTDHKNKNNKKKSTVIKQQR